MPIYGIKVELSNRTWRSIDSSITQLQSFSEGTVYKDLSVELPDLEETQIVDNEEDQVSVF